ncbi:hypothetical protein, partial [Umezakia ovalisporum]|uniref:hypothetical protein n=1 Tax=Umezakia ovalisporum TaxID=75695 RepID=UPI0039C6C4CB
MTCKITDYRLLVDCWSGGLRHNFVYLNAEGDTINSQFMRAYIDYLVRVNNNGVFMALYLNGAPGLLKGIMFDSNGTRIDSFNHTIGDPLLVRGSWFTYSDSYTDSLGNVVLHITSEEGPGGRDKRVYHVTINPLGQLVKVKDYGLASPVTFY